MTEHKIDATRSGSLNGMDWDAEYIITFSYVSGSPDYYNTAGGHWEQGWGPEVSLVSVVPEIGVLDHGAFTDLAQKDLDNWAADWLDEHMGECIEIAEAARHIDPDDARDDQMDRELRR